MQCVILAGGLATRLQPITLTLPKFLVPVAGRPFADHQLAWLRESGVTDVVLCIAHQGGQIRDHVGDGSAFGVRVVYVDEGDELRGTAGALRLAYEEGALADAFALVYGDSYLPLDVGAVVRRFAARDVDALMTVFRNDDAFDASNASFQDGWVVRYDKATPDPAMAYIDYGLSVLSRDAVVAAIPSGKRVDLAAVYAALAAERRLAGFEVHERFYEVGSHAGLAELERRLSI